MRYNHYGTVLVHDQFLHLLITLFLKLGISHAQDLIDQHDIRLKNRRDRKCQFRIHTARIRLHRHVDKFSQIGKLYDLIHLIPHFLLGKSQQHAR